MLPGLRLDRFIRCNRQQHEVDAAGPCQHVLDETLVARHIDEGYTDVWKLQVREADVDGDPPLLLLLEAVGIDTGQSFDEFCLSVVDVAGRSGDDVFHRASKPVY